MNSKASKRRKHETSRKVHNENEDKAEVFVLPPNLLEKLGIQLGNIQPTQEYPTPFNNSDINTAKPTHKNKAVDVNTENLHLNYNSSIQKDTSILKTASLMKESVFLSPTFVPTLADVIAGEVEIANTLSHTSSNGELNIESNKNFSDVINIEKKINDDNENGTLDPSQRLLRANKKSIITLQKQEENFRQELSCLETAITESINQVITGEKLDEYPVSPDVFSKDLSDIEKTNETEKVIHPLSRISEDNLPSRNLECNNHVNTDIENSEKITLEDLKLKDSIHYDTLLTNDIKYLDSSGDFLNSPKLKPGSISTGEITKSTFPTNEEEPKNKVKILSQQIVNYKKIFDRNTTPLIKNKLIPVTKDTILSSRKDASLSPLQSTESKSPPNSYPLQQQEKASICSEEISPIKNMNGCLEEDFNGKDRADMQMLYNNSLSLDVSGEKKYFSDTTEFEIFEKVCSSVVSVNTDHNYKSFNDHNELKELSAICILNICNEMTDIHDKGETVLSVNNNTISEFNMSVANSVVDVNIIKNVEMHENIDIEQHQDGDVEFKEPHMNYFSKDNYLNEIQIDLNIHDLMSSNITTNEQEKERTKSICISTGKEKASNTIIGQTQLKNCVQGVEKPGGSDLTTFSINNTGLKTYEREKQRDLKIMQHSLGSQKVNTVTTNDSDITLKEVTTLGFDDSIQDYCLCNDFGHLSFYDHDDAYEHIHFLETKSVCNDPEVIFGMYYENTDVYTHGSHCDLLDIEVVHEKKTTQICWKVISKDYVCKNVESKDKLDNQDKEALSDSVDFNIFNKHYSKNENDQDSPFSKSFIDSSEIISELVTPSNNKKNEVTPDVLNNEDLEDSITVIQLINDEDLNEMPVDENVGQIKKKLVQSPMISQANNVTEMISERNNDINIPSNNEKNEVASFIDLSKIISELVTPSNKKNEVAPDVLNNENLEDSITVIQLINDEDFNEMPVDENVGQIKTKLVQSSMISQADNVTEMIYETYNEVNIPVFTKLDENKNIPKHSSKYPEVQYKNVKQANNSSVGQYDQTSQMKPYHIVQNHASPNEKTLNDKIEVPSNEVALNNEDMEDSITVIQLIDDEELNEIHLNEIVGQANPTVLGSTAIFQVDNVTKVISEDKLMVPERNNGINIPVNIKTEPNKNITQRYSNCSEVLHENHKQANTSSVIEQVNQLSQKKPNSITQNHASLNERNVVRRAESNCNTNKSCTGNEVIDETHIEIVPKPTVEAEESSILKKRKPLPYVGPLVEPEAKRKRPRSCERRLSLKMDEAPSNKNVECGVCNQLIAEAHWKDHASQMHSCVAWKRGQNIDFDNDDFVEELIQRLKIKKILECKFCCFKMNHLDTFILHIKICKKLKDKFLMSRRVDSSILSASDLIHEDAGDNTKIMKSIKCGLCKQIVESMLWPEHLRGHDYLTWKEGDPVLNLEDKEEVHQHLISTSKLLGGLKCKRCGLVRKQAKKFLNHVNKCETNILDSTDTDCANTSSTSADVTLDPSVGDSIQMESIDHNVVKEPAQEIANKNIDSIDVDSTSTKCGVCKEVVDNERWLDHARGHDYLTWKDGEPVIVLDDEEQVRRHLMQISKELGGLTCNKCGVVRKQPKRFLDHVGECGNDELISLPDTDCANSTLMSADVTLDSSSRFERRSRFKNITSEQFPKKVTCGVCKKQVNSAQWFSHIRIAHNYLAWKIEETPLNLEDKDEVRDHLKVISIREDGLVCNRCGVRKRYPKVFLDHVQFCTADIQNVNDSHNVSLNGDATLDSSEVASEGSRRESTDDVRPSRRRKRARISSLSDENEVVVSKKSHLEVPECVVKCGVCKKDIQESMWITHIGEAHNYIAWKDGDQSFTLEDDEAMLYHLVALTQTVEKLTCFKCKYSRRKARAFLEHIKQCNGEDVVMEDTLDSDSKNVTCGVCKNEVNINLWIEHIKDQHNYLAWIEGEPPLDLEDFDAVRDYLKTISKREGGLYCSKCNVKKKYPKLFLDHLRHCVGKLLIHEVIDNNSCNLSNIDEKAKCGVCSKEIPAGDWIKHIQGAHNYLAWREGDKPIELEDKDSVKEYLNGLLKKIPNLVCVKCGFSRRFAARYMEHMETCDGVRNDDLNSKNEGLFECAICHENILPNKWKDHAMDRHYNVAWVVGDIPIDLKSPYGAEKYLKEYKRVKKNLVCNTCGETRASFIGFYVHIIACGKSEQEIDMYKDDCTICGNKYFSVYRSSHYAMHREKELTKERQLERLRQKMNEPEIEEQQEEEPMFGRRKAAEKAKNVIKKYQKDAAEAVYEYKCGKCNFGTDMLMFLKKHKCDADIGSDSEVSEEESSNSSISSEHEVPDDEDKVERRKDSTTTTSNWLPFKFLNWRSYYDKLLSNFHKTHCNTYSILFPEWRMSQYDFITDDQVNKYMPKLTKSCKVRVEDSWNVYNKFEGFKTNRVNTIFVGGSIQYICWAPARLGSDEDEHSYLAMSIHLDGDVPRHDHDDLPAHPALIQIWDFISIKNETPRFALGISHDYGTVWSMDWCPSGARDIFDENIENKTWVRLGLLAVACSNGSAYIFSVPYPDSIVTGNNVFVKLKPVAELKNCSPNSDRKKYQATAITWSKRKGHSDVVVGYADGCIARYDLTTESPFLKITEDDMTVFYPYHDERSQNSCVTDVDSFPGIGASRDAICVASPTGAVLSSGSIRPTRVTSHVPAVLVKFTQAWPTVMLAGDDGLVVQSPSELEWHGTERRLGAMSRVADCNICGRAIIHTPPLLRTTTLFPLHYDHNKAIIASLNIVHIESKDDKRKQKNDELAVTMEPTTYDNAIKKYGIELKLLKRGFKASTAPRESFPERFPLADVTSMAFCPTKTYHEWAAVATHSGIVFIFKAV